MGDNMSGKPRTLSRRGAKNAGKCNVSENPLRSLRLCEKSGSLTLMQHKHQRTRSTTILTVRHKGRVAIGGDGQVSIGSTVMKSDAVKIRPLADGRVIAGFAGGAADAFA